MKLKVFVKYFTVVLLSAFTHLKFKHIDAIAHRGKQCQKPVQAHFACRLQRQTLVGANWKAWGSPQQIEKWIAYSNSVPDTLSPISPEIFVAPPMLYVHYVKKRLKSGLRVASQDVSCIESYGAHTGEISAQMLADADIPTCIVGHSERRKGLASLLQGESNELVALKAKIAISKGRQVVFCIGENALDRQHKQTENKLNLQLTPLAQLLPNESWKNCVIAYEPVWAIGTGNCATPEIAEETHSCIRKWIARNVGTEIANCVRIIYGGSVKKSNALNLIQRCNIDGFLIGGASQTEEFKDIVELVKNHTQLQQ